MNIHSMLSHWKVKCQDASRARRMSDQKSVALGFAWRAKNIGGVRRHLECIEKYSRFPIALYPSTSSDALLGSNVDRNWYHGQLGDELIGRHDLFHTHVDPKFIQIANNASQCGKPWVHTYHTLYFAGDQGGHLLPWQQRINDSLLNHARNADVRISVASWLTGYLESNHGIESTHIPNGVDVSACDQADAQRFERQFGVQSFVLFVGSNAAIKNPLVFVEAARRFPDVNFVMIGSGLTRERLPKTLNAELPANVAAIGPLPHGDVLDAIAASRVLVMTSHREGLPTVLLEAMAMSKPCVAPRSYGCQDVIGCSDFGLLYEPGEGDDLQNKIELAIRLDSIPKARQRVDQLFSWPVVTKRLDEIYARLLSSSAASEAKTKSIT